MWVDNRADVRMRGDSIFVRTIEGAKARDEGSECSQPFPYNSVSDFQVRQTAGRSHVTLTQEPSRMNNYTAVIAIEDTQGGGDTYAFEVSWHADTNVANAPAPFFDDIRACQDAVRQRFVSQNGRGSYIDFESFANRHGRDWNGDSNGSRSGDAAQYRTRTHGQESIQGRGIARRSDESRDLTYYCVIDTRQNQVVSGVYQYSSAPVRMSDRQENRQLR